MTIREAGQTMLIALCVILPAVTYLNYVSEPATDTYVASESVTTANWRRWRMSEPDTDYDTDLDPAPEPDRGRRRRIINPDGKRMFDGSRINKMSTSILYLAGSLLALIMVLSFGFSRFKKIAGI